jgi:hypothetical protein
MRNGDSNSAKFSAGAIVGEPQCIAAITGTARRRIRSVQEKARILASLYVNRRPKLTPDWSASLRPDRIRLRF